MAKKVFYDDDARKRVLAGAEILYNAVKTTMGPKGRNVVISKVMAARPSRTTASPLPKVLNLATSTTKRSAKKSAPNSSSKPPAK